MPTLTEYRTQLSRLQGQRDKIRQDLDTHKADAVKWQQEAEWSEEARTRLQDVAQKTQKQLEYHIGELVSLANAAVFPNPYELKVEFVLRRGKTECDLIFTRDGQEYRDVLLGIGGGALDVSAFALQVASWTLARPRSRAVLLCDEPLKWLKGTPLPEKGAEMVKLISEKIGLQIIYISHIPEQIASADRVFEFTKRQGVTEVKEG